MTNCKENVQRAIRISSLILLLFGTTLFQAQAQDQVKAIEYFNKGVDALTQKNYKQAIELYSLAIKEDPSYTKAYYNRANAKLTIKAYEDAINDFDLTIRQDPDFKKAHLYKGYALMKLKM